MRAAATVLAHLSAVVALAAARVQSPPAPATQPAVQPPAVQAPAPARTKPPSAEQVAEARRAALARDPTRLPQAAAERWKDFDPQALRPESVPHEFIQARQSLGGGDLPATIVLLLAALEHEPDFPPALHQLGVVYFQLQRYGDALACFQRYLAVVPTRVADTRGLAHALYSLGRYAEARAHYERVLAAAPTDTEALRGLALARYRLGDVDGALADLTRVLERDPEHADAWTWKAQVLLDLDRADEARAAAEKARDLVPWSPRPWFVLASALTDLGRDPDARAARERFQLLSRVDQEIRRLESHLENEPGDVGARRALVNAQAEVGDRRSVRKNLARILADRPEDVSAHVFVLDVCDRIGDVEAGRLAARDLERVGAESATAWKRLEAWYGARRDRAKQIEAGERWRRASQP